MPATRDRAAITCAYAVHLVRDRDAPVQVIAGQLRIEGQDAFGEALPLADALGWEGAGRVRHLWIMMGSHIVDIALVRQAYGADGQKIHLSHCAVLPATFEGGDCLDAVNVGAR